MYENPDKVNHEYLECYKNMPNLKKDGNNEDLQLEDLQRMQSDYICEQVEKFAGKNIILVGHHPITGYKYKEEKKKDKKKDGKEKEKKKEKKTGLLLMNASNTFIELLTQIFRLKGSRVKYYYLCADLHLYQKGIVTISMPSDEMTIEQYIVGTGGTDLDPSPLKCDVDIDYFTEPRNFNYEDGNISGVYTMNTTQEKYGFLVCNYENPDNIEMEFIPVELSMEALSDSATMPTMQESSSSSGYATIPTSTQTLGGKRSKHKRSKKKGKKGKKSKRSKSMRKSKRRH